MLGSNVPTIGGLPKGFEHADKWGCECIQIYLTLSRRWDVPVLSRKDISEFKNAWKKSGVKEVVAHLPYLANLASPDKDIHAKATNRLITELDRAGEMEVSFIVAHPGSHRSAGVKAGIDRTVDALNRALASTSNVLTKILLETMAGQGTEMGSSFEQLAEIIGLVKQPERLGICFDTCHVFAAGYDVSFYEGYEKTMEQLDKIVGIRNVGAFHLNDSKEDLGSCIDRHASIGEGHLGLECFHAVVKDSRFLDTPKILEIPERDEKSQQNLDLLRKLQTLTKEEVSHDQQAKRIHSRPKIRRLF